MKQLCKKKCQNKKMTSSDTRAILMKQLCKKNAKTNKQKILVQLSDPKNNLYFYAVIPLPVQALRAISS